jgi:hypothetical protein
VGGDIRVVLVGEPDRWVASFATDPDLSVASILGAVSGRSALEQGSTEADIQLSQKQTSNLRGTAEPQKQTEADIQLSWSRAQKQTSNFRGAKRGRTASAARILRNQPESAHSGV